MTDALSEVERLVPAMDAALTGRKLGASLDRALTKLSDSARQVDRFEALATLAQLLEVGRHPDAAGVLEEAIDIVGDASRLMQRAATIEDLDTVVAEYPGVLAALRDLENSVRALWRGVVQADFAPLIAVGRVLVQIDDLADLGRRLDALGRDAQRTVEGQVTPEALAKDVPRLRAARDVLDAELHAVTGESEVDRFLKAVTTATATLADVTPGVLRWLDLHHASSTFRVQGAR